MKEFSIDQVLHLRTLEKQWQKIYGIGLHRYLQDLIDSLQNPNQELRRQLGHLRHAKLLWDVGIGPLAGHAALDEYAGGLSPLPASMLSNERKPPHLTLVDPRGGIINMCNALGITITSPELNCLRTKSKNESREASWPMYWIACQIIDKVYGEESDQPIQDCNTFEGLSYIALYGLHTTSQIQSIAFEATKVGDLVAVLSWSENIRELSFKKASSCNKKLVRSPSPKTKK